MNGGVAGLNWRRSLAALGMVSLAGACNSSPPPGEPPGAVEVVTSPSMQRFVAFRQSALTLEALETPTVPPVTVGSTVSADLLTTSDSGVVGVDAAGNLIGPSQRHGNHSQSERFTAGSDGRRCRVYPPRARASRSRRRTADDRACVGG